MMERSCTSKVIFVILFFGWSLSSLSGENLKNYRQSDLLPNYVREVTERREAFFRTLQTNSHGDELLRDLKLDGLPVVRARRPHFSTFFKDRISPAAQELMRRDQQDAPSVFDPSKFLSEIDEEEFLRDRAVVLNAIGSIDVFASELLGFESRQKEAAARVAGPGAVEPGLYPVELAAAAAISRFLDEKLPKNEEQNAVVLKLLRVEVYDGIVSRLIFEVNLDGKPHQVAMSLEMLSSFRSGRDAYYVHTLSIVFKSISRRLQDFYKKDERGLVEFDESGAPILRSLKKEEKIQKGILEAALDLVKVKAEGALVAYDVMGRLSPAQIDFLLGFFVDLRGDDLPIVRDFENFQKNLLPPLNIEEHRPYPQLLVDFQYYQQLYRDLEAVERAVVTLREKQNFEREVIEEIEGLKK